MGLTRTYRKKSITITLNASISHQAGHNLPVAPSSSVSIDVSPLITFMYAQNIDVLNSVKRGQQTCWNNAG
jgi:hypothetical protein